MHPDRLRDQRPILTVVEEATHLVRSAPVTAWLVYCVGAAPFIAYLFFFWSDMSRSSLAPAHLRDASLVLGLLYWWMKVCQALFCGQLLRMLEEERSPRPMPRRGWLRLVSSQAWIHATMPWVYIVAGVAVIPMGWVYAFYHNVTILAVEHYRNGGRTKELISQALTQSRYRPGQNHAILGLLLIMALLVYGNLLAGFALGSYLLKAVTGVENEFSRNGSLLGSSPMQLLLISGSYFAMWPLVKSFYILRCFYGQARRTGADLKVQLRRLAATNAATLGLIIAVALASAPSPSLGRPSNESGEANKLDKIVLPTLKPEPLPDGQISSHGQELGRSIKDVLAGSDYQWRFPREKVSSQKDDSWLGSLVRDSIYQLRRLLEDIGKFLKDWLYKNPKDKDKSESKSNGLGAWVGKLEYVLVGLAVVLLCLLGWMVYRNWKRSRKALPAALAEAAPPINLESEQVLASQLPENEWLRLAREKMEAGELRLALRALFLATLAHLGEKRLIQVSRTKSNGDYLHEVSVRARSRREVEVNFREQVRVFERIWYGWHEVSQELVDGFLDHHERIVSHAA